MNRIKQFLSQSNFVLITLIILGIHSLVEVNMAQAIIVLAFAGLQGYTSYLNSLKQKDLDSEVRKELNDIRTHITAMTLKNTARQQPANDGRRFF